MSRLVLKYPEPVVTEENGHGALFDITPQSAPVIPSTLQTEWEQLQSALRTRLTGEVTMTCHPHRIGHRGCVSLCFQGEQGRTDVLITVSGRAQFPPERRLPFSTLVYRCRRYGGCNVSGALAE